METEVAQLILTSCRSWVDYLAALLTPTIAVFGALIAYRQWSTNANRLKSELFDRRYEQYLNVRDFLASIQASGRVKDEAVQKFQIAIKGVRFIFDKEISEYISENILKPANRVSALQDKLEGLAVGGDRTKVVHEKSIILSKLYQELKILEDTFSRYLQLQH